MKEKKNLKGKMNKEQQKKKQEKIKKEGEK